MMIRKLNDASKRSASAKALTQALGQSEEVKELVQESAEQLSSVNAVLTQELEQDPQPGVEDALERSKHVETMVQEANDKLADVNVALAHEVTERHALEVHLTEITEQGEADRHASLHDPLTGLPNRALFNDRLEHGLAQAVRHRWMLAVMFLDLNDFKDINDLHGHDVGDAVLKAIAERLKDTTRGDDTISRHGGDEFMYLLMEIQQERDIVPIVEKLIAVIQRPCDISNGEERLSLSVHASIGIAIYPKDGNTADALTRAADTAMYRAKRDKSRFAFA